MGVRLISEVLVYAPDDFSPSEMVVLLVLAENANDMTRECWPGIETFARRTRMTPSGVRRVMWRWSQRVPPFEVRVPIGKGQDGRPVFGAKGHRTVYHLPPLAPERRDSGHANTTPKGATTVTPSPAKGVTKGTQRRDHRNAKALPLSRPSPQEPSGTVISRARTRAAQLVADLGADDDEIKIILEKIKAERRPRSLDAYVATMAECGDLADIVTECLVQRRRVLVAVLVAELRTRPDCVHGDPGGDQPHPVTGEPLCPLCRRSAP